MGHPFDVEHATAMHVEWCRDLAQRMGVNTTHQSGPQMRAVMLELRDTLAPACVLIVANALPALERGIFLEGWSLDKSGPRDISAEDFCDRVYRRVEAHHFRVSSLVSDVFWLWSEKLPPKKAAAIFACLPSALQSLWPAGQDKGSTGS